jgi:Zn-dependent protease
MKWSWRLGRFAGINVYVHATFLLLIAWLVLTEWRQTHSTRAVTGAVLFILSLFACVVIHEFGHALAARYFGIATRDITLLPIGGVSRVERIPDDPRQESCIALAGPLVSLAVAAAIRFFLWAVYAPTPMSQMLLLASWPEIYQFVVQLMVANGVLAAFNLLPAFPMDGGRIFRALLARRMDYSRATRIAANVGQGMAFIFAFVGMFGNPFLVLVGLFIWIGAEQEAVAAKIRVALRGIRVNQVTVADFKHR